MTEWAEIERAARREAELSRKSIEAAGLAVGDRVAWAEYANARTNGFSPVHRVAALTGEPETYCGEKVPPPVCRLDLRAWPSDLEECHWCKLAYGKVAWRQSA